MRWAVRNSPVEKVVPGADFLHFEHAQCRRDIVPALTSALVCAPRRGIGSMAGGAVTGQSAGDRPRAIQNPALRVRAYTAHVHHTHTLQLGLTVRLWLCDTVFR